MQSIYFMPTYPGHEGQSIPEMKRGKKKNGSNLVYSLSMG